MSSKVVRSEPARGSDASSPLVSAGFPAGSGDEVALLYSGGADSSLAACTLAKTFRKVHLNTFSRPGFMACRFSDSHFLRMRERFPDSEFFHRLIPAGKFYAEVEGRGRWQAFKKHGLLILNSCGHCKTALHWRNLIFCLQNGIKYAADGAVVGAEEFAEQNPRILMPELSALYAAFGITLLHPVYEEGLSTELTLYELGISPQPKIKMTAKDMQVVCSQQIMFAMMMRLLLEKRSFAEYERLARAYLSEKLEVIKLETRLWLENPAAKTRVAELLKE